MLRALQVGRVTISHRQFADVWFRHYQVENRLADVGCPEEPHARKKKKESVDVQIYTKQKLRKITNVCLGWGGGHAFFTTLLTAEQKRPGKRDTTQKQTPFSPEYIQKKKGGKGGVGFQKLTKRNQLLNPWEELLLTAQVEKKRRYQKKKGSCGRKHFWVDHFLGLYLCSVGLG